ncbi:MAG TPA: hypothetical protein VIY48_10530 [Candidatus Paceibacterota bacterium]
MHGIALTESKTEKGHAVAKKALEVLTKYYPGYSWFVRCDGGVLDIKAAEIGRASMVRHLNKIEHDWTIFEKDILMAAGEFLERAYLLRGISRGEVAKKLDGGEKIRWQPRV